MTSKANNNKIKKAQFTILKLRFLYYFMQMRIWRILFQIGLSGENDKHAHQDAGDGGEGGELAAVHDDGLGEDLTEAL